MTNKTPPRVKEVLQQMVRELGSVNKVVKKTGITHNTIGSWLEGRSEPENESLEKLAIATGKTVAWLRSADIEDFQPLPPPNGLIPVISMSSGGTDGPCWEDAYPVGSGMEMIHRPHDVSDPRAFAIKIDGDSMAPRYEHGEIVVVDSHKQIVSGDYALVKLTDGRSLVKRLRYINGMVILESINPAHSPIVVQKSEIVCAYKVVWKKEG